MPEYVWVREKLSGAHGPVQRGEYDANPDAYEALKKDPLNANGDPLPWESAEPTGQSATTKKES